MGSGLLQLSRGVRNGTKPYRAIIAAGLPKPQGQDRKYKLKLAICGLHGTTEFRSVKDYKKNENGEYKNNTPRFRCMLCYKLKKKNNRIRNIKSISQNKKQKLVKMAGGSCQICGYKKCLAAMHFHHIDPLTKNFEIAF
jgi:hypothetical protein